MLAVDMQGGVSLPVRYCWAKDEPQLRVEAPVRAGHTRTPVLVPDNARWVQQVFSSWRQDDRGSRVPAATPCTPSADEGQLPGRPSQGRCPSLLVLLATPDSTEQ